MNSVLTTWASCVGGWLVDVTARRPSGVIGRYSYGGARGAPRAHEPIFDEALELLGPVEGARCLEIGCGGGAMLERLLSRGAAVVAALDHSPDMLALAMAYNQRAVADERLQLKLGDAARIPWPDQTFDVAVSVNMFFFMAEPQQVLDELFRVLRVGGRLVVVTAPGPLPKASPQHWWVYFWGPSLHVHTDADMARMFERAGFTDVRIDSDGALQHCRGSRPR